MAIEVTFMTKSSRLCFRFIDCTILQTFKPLTNFCGCTDRFVSDLVGNPEDSFSHGRGSNVTYYMCPLPGIRHHLLETKKENYRQFLFVIFRTTNRIVK